MNSIVLYGVLLVLGCVTIQEAESNSIYWWKSCNDFSRSTKTLDDETAPKGIVGCLCNMDKYSRPAKEFHDCYETESSDKIIWGLCQRKAFGGPLDENNIEPLLCGKFVLFLLPAQQKYGECLEEQYKKRNLSNNMATDILKINTCQWNLVRGF